MFCQEALEAGSYFFPKNGEVPFSGMIPQLPGIERIPSGLKDFYRLDERLCILFIKEDPGARILISGTPIL